MVAVLEGRHGCWAADVAEFFSTMHSLKGDAGRSWAWAGVGRDGTPQCPGSPGEVDRMRT